jgi:hypothetical protein
MLSGVIPSVNAFDVDFGGEVAEININHLPHPHFCY